MTFPLNKTFEKLKYDLVKDNLISFESLEQADEIASAQKINIAQVLINSGLLEEEKLLKFIESKLHIPYVNLDDYSIDVSCLKYINFNDVQKYKIIPLFKIEDCLTVAMSDPLNLFAIDKLIDETGFNIEPVLSSEKAILNKIEKYFETSNTVGQIVMEKEHYETHKWQDTLHTTNVSDENTTELIRSIVTEAISKNVHELFFEVCQDGLNVNFKKEFDIENTGCIPNILSASFIARIKTLANLDPAVSEIPQLGKLIFKVDDSHLVASVSAFPTIHGERIALKIYKPPKNIESFPFEKNDIKKISESLNTPGIILVCGSSLSGKTHLIYSILSDFIKSNPQKNIMTIESIAKFDIESVNQCELNENIGFNLQKAMRFIEFQSPDIVYFEAIGTSEGLEFCNSLIYRNKTILTEFLTNNIADLRHKLSLNEFVTFRSLLSCVIFIHSSESYEVFDKNALKKYL